MLVWSSGKKKKNVDGRVPVKQRSAKDNDVFAATEHLIWDPVQLVAIFARTGILKERGRPSRLIGCIASSERAEKQLAQLLKSQSFLPLPAITLCIKPIPIWNDGCRKQPSSFQLLRQPYRFQHIPYRPMRTLHWTRTSASTTFAVVVIRLTVLSSELDQSQSITTNLLQDGGARSC